MSDLDRVLLREVLTKLDQVLKQQARILAQLEPTYTATLVPPPVDAPLTPIMPAFLEPPWHAPDTTDGK